MVPLTGTYKDIVKSIHCYIHNKINAHKSNNLLLHSTIKYELLNTMLDYMLLQSLHSQWTSTLIINYILNSKWTRLLIIIYNYMRNPYSMDETLLNT